MSVYTDVLADDLQGFLDHYQAGELRTFTGIRDGIENSNYFVTTRTGDYVLTLFERAAPTEIEYALRFMSHLVQHGLPCARPMTDRQGHTLGELSNKPASLVMCLKGRSVFQPGADHCRAVGRTLAELHLAGQHCQDRQLNPRGANWRQTMARKIRGWLNTDQQQLLDDELRSQQRDFAGLPQGVIHADLFRDNVLFTGTELTGLIDLYHCGQDLLLYDLAIAANDWCTHASGEFDNVRLRALLETYAERRPVTPHEQQCWPDLLRRAALRFWLSRLDNLYTPRAGQLTQQKDPGVYQQLLLNYRQRPPVWPA